MTTGREGERLELLPDGEVRRLSDEELQEVGRDVHREFVRAQRRVKAVSERLDAAATRRARERAAGPRRRWRAWLLRLALGRRTYDYVLRSLAADPRAPRARSIDIVVRKDGAERRIEADWVRTIARLVEGEDVPSLAHGTNGPDRT